MALALSSSPCLVSKHGASLLLLAPSARLHQNAAPPPPQIKTVWRKNQLLPGVACRVPEGAGAARNRLFSFRPVTCPLLPAGPQTVCCSWQVNNLIWFSSLLNSEARWSTIWLHTMRYWAVKCVCSFFRSTKEMFFIIYFSDRKTSLTSINKNNNNLSISKWEIRRQVTYLSKVKPFPFWLDMSS